MAAPTPVVKNFYDGFRGMLRYYVAWTAGVPDDLADNNALDISTLGPPAPNSVKIRSVDVIMNGNYQLDVEFDATTDELFDRFIGQTDVTYQFFRNYTQGPNTGYVSDPTAAGFVGDLLVTTTGAANGDELNMLIIYEKST